MHAKHGSGGVENFASSSVRIVHAKVLQGADMIRAGMHAKGLLVATLHSTHRPLLGLPVHAVQLLSIPFRFTVVGPGCSQVLLSRIPAPGTRLGPHLRVEHCVHGRVVMLPSVAIVLMGGDVHL